MLTNADLKKISSLVHGEIVGLEKKVVGLEKKMEAGFRKVHRELKLIVSFLNKEDVELQKRVGRIEVHLGLPRLN